MIVLLWKEVVAEKLMVKEEKQDSASQLHRLDKAHSADNGDKCALHPVSLNIQRSSNDVRAMLVMETDVFCSPFP